MTRRLPITLLGVVAFVGIASFAVWRWVEGRMEQGFADWRQAMAAQGWTVQAATTARGGWPLAADFSLGDVSIAGGANDLPGGLAYTAARLTIHLDLLQPTAVVVRGEGRQTLRLGPTKPLPFTAERLAVTVPLAQGGPPGSAALEGKKLRFGAPAEGLTIGLLQGQADWHRAAAATPETLGLHLSAEAIALPPPPAPQAALGPHIASATVDGTLAGTLPANPPSPAAAAAAWRDSGGALTLNHIALGWGPLGVTGTASFKLDAALQPEVTTALRLIGIDDTLTALAAGHVITPRAAEAAKAVMGLLAHARHGEVPGVEAPLTLRDGTVSLGVIPLATIGKLNWPNGS